MMIQTYTIEQAQEGHVSLQWWNLQTVSLHTIEQEQEGHVSLQWWYKLTP